MKNRTRAKFADQEPDFPNQCAAANRHGTRCRKSAVLGGLVCRLHGGTSVSGVGHYNFRHGRQSKHRYAVPAALKADYEWQLEQGPSLMEGRDEMALIVARIQALFDRIDRPNITPFTSTAADPLRQRGRALEEHGNSEEMRELVHCPAGLTGFNEDPDAMDEIWALVDLLRKLRAVETRRISLEHDVMTVDQARVFINAVQEAVTSAIRLAGDRDLETRMRRHFASELREILDIPRDSQERKDQ